MAEYKFKCFKIRIQEDTCDMDILHMDVLVWNKSVFKEIKDTLNYLNNKYKRLRAVVPVENKKLIKFCKMLGWEVTKEADFEIDGAIKYCYVVEKL
jgi:hypothetical protein